jgi:hypothetical protein
MSPELKKFKDHFIQQTRMNPIACEENRTFMHWKRLIFAQLNCNDMEKISNYIKETFSTPGKFSHHLPKIQGWENNCIALTVDVSQIKEFIK